MSLFAHRLLVVTGKGGVGRTTTAAALGAAATAAGKRAIVVEMDGLRGLSVTMGMDDRSYAPRPTELGPSVMSLTPTDAIEDFGRRKLRLNALVGLVFRSRLMGTFIDAVPGLNDLVQLGKIEDMLNSPLPGETPWDLVILDAPATGHGLTLLAAARSMAEITRVGPFYELASIIERLLSDRTNTGIVITTLAEELPVAETLQLLDALEVDGSQVAAVVVNQVREPRLPDTPAWPAVRQRFHACPDDDVRVHAILADRAWGRQVGQADALEQLQRGLEGRNALPTALLPRVPGGRLDLGDLRAFGEHLTRQLKDIL